jgi:hypothetical protein
MATSNPNEPTYVDMSHLVPIDLGLCGGESMSGGNTTSRPLPSGAAGAPGSEPVNPPPPGTVNDNPEMDIKPFKSYTKKVGK